MALLIVLAYAGCVDPDPDPLDVLAARYPRWRVWRGAANGLVYAWLLRSSPPVVLRDKTVAGLRARLDEFGRVLAERMSRAEALAAAERLET